MKDRQPKLTPQTAAVLDQLVQNERLSGADIGRKTALKSGTLYPLLFRLEEAGWLTSEWETAEPIDLGRPRRRYYSVTGVGRAHVRDAAKEHAAIFGRLALS